MATVKDPITGQTGDIGAQNEAVFQQDVLGAQKRAERMANATQTTQSNIVNLAPVVPTAITSSDLQPQAPVTVPTVPTPTTASSVAGSTQSLIERMVANRELEATKAAKQSEDDYKATFDQITGVQESVGKVQDELKVNEKEATKDKLLADLEMSQRAQLNAIRELEKNPRGLFGGALEQEKQRINREFAYEQADKALLYEVANRDFARAAEQADRKIALQLEPLKMKLDFQSKFYEVNQNKLTKAQDNTLQALIAKNEREYESEQSRLKTLEDTRLEILSAIQESSASPEEKAMATYKVNKATSPEEIIVAGGSMVADKKKASGGSSVNRTNDDSIRLTNDEKNRITALGFETTPIEFQNIVVNALTSSEAREFADAWKAEQQRLRQSIDPITFLEVWAAQQDEEQAPKESGITNPFKNPND